MIADAPEAGIRPRPSALPSRSPAPAPPAPYRFEFADLAPQLQLKVVAGGSPWPAAAATVAAAPLPHWLPPLSPALPQPLRLGFALRPAPGFGGMLRDGLAGVFATAGGPAGIRVTAWEQGLVVAGRDLERMPSEPLLHLVPVDLDEPSFAAAADIVRVARDRCVLVVNGPLPGLEAWLAGRTGLALDRLAGLVRFPFLGPWERNSGRRGVCPALVARPLTGAVFGRACLNLARLVVARAREAEE